MNIRDLQQKIESIRIEVDKAFSEFTEVSDGMLSAGFDEGDRQIAVDYATRTSFSFEKTISDLGRLNSFMKENAAVFSNESDEDGGESWRLDEGFRGDWAILPATMTLYGKRTVGIIEAASTWDKCSIFVCQKDGESRLLFVSGSGEYEGYGINIGQSYSTYHDQTGASKGLYTVLNMVYIVNGEIVKKENDIGLDKKASLSVFK